MKLCAERAIHTLGSGGFQVLPWSEQTQWAVSLLDVLAVTLSKWAINLHAMTDLALSLRHCEQHSLFPSLLSL